jgi:hypothetical protein
MFDFRMVKRAASVRVAAIAARADVPEGALNVAHVVKLYHESHSTAGGGPTRNSNFAHALANEDPSCTLKNTTDLAPANIKAVVKKVKGHINKLAKLAKCTDGKQRVCALNLQQWVWPGTPCSDPKAAKASLPARPAKQAKRERSSAALSENRQEQRHKAEVFYFV